MELLITKHAYERARERLRWRCNALDKMAILAFDNGIKHCDTKGALNKYILLSYGLIIKPQIT